MIHPFFFFNDTATTDIYTLSLHDALPISGFRYDGKIGRLLGEPTATRVFHETMQVAPVGDGTAWVVDRVHHRIVQLHVRTGEVVRVCGERGFLTGFFNWPEGIAIDPATGQLWITNTKQYNVHILGPDC